MLDQILSTLQSQAAPELMSKFGLTEQQTNGSIQAATDSVTEVIGSGHGFGMDDVLNLFSDAKNTGAADGVLDRIAGALQGKLTGQVGLNASQANGVQAMLMPLLTDLISKYVGGNAGNLQQLIGSLSGGQGGGIADMAQGMLGKLFK